MLLRIDQNKCVNHNYNFFWFLFLIFINHESTKISSYTLWMHLLPLFFINIYTLLFQLQLYHCNCNWHLIAIIIVIYPRPANNWVNVEYKEAQQTVLLSSASAVPMIDAVQNWILSKLCLKWWDPTNVLSEKLNLHLFFLMHFFFKIKTICWCSFIINCNPACTTTISCMYYILCLLLPLSNFQSKILEFDALFLMTWIFFDQFKFQS